MTEKNIETMPIDKFQIKYDCVDRSILDGLREPIVFIFGLNKSPDFRFFQVPQTIYFKETNLY